MKIQITYGKGSSGRWYTYDSNGESVNVGDVVEVPGTWINPSNQLATVMAMGSDYNGPATKILRVVERAESRLFT